MKHKVSPSARWQAFWMLISHLLLPSCSSRMTYLMTKIRWPEKTPLKKVNKKNPSAKYNWVCRGFTMEEQKKAVWFSFKPAHLTYCFFKVPEEMLIRELLFLRKRHTAHMPDTFKHISSLDTNTMSAPSGSLKLSSTFKLCASAYLLFTWDGSQSLVQCVQINQSRNQQTWWKSK